MQDQDLVTTIRLKVDADGVTGGLTSVKRSIADLGTAVKDITDKTNAALGKVGSAELPVAAGLEKASKSVIKQTGEIEKAIATFGSVASTSLKSAYKSIEAEEIRLRGAGIDPAIFKPYLDKLREIQKLNGIVSGQAAAQAAQAEQLAQSKAAQQAKLLQLSEGIAANNKRVADVINAQAARELKDIKDRTAAIAAYSAEARNAELNMVHTGRGKSVGFLTDKGKDLGLQDAEINRILAGNKKIEASMAAAFAAANPNLGKMKELADASGTSVKGLSAALRQVPAQFTDIVVSLQGGQAPLTVLLQQGGQLKDVFGGIGPAARALGGYIAGLVNPFTIAAAAAAAFGYAMYSLNTKESALLELSTQLTGTGRASAAAVGDIKLLVLELNKIPGVSKSSATAILGEFAKVEGLGGDLFKSLGSRVADFAAATGTELPAAASKLAAAFADPAKGARELEGALGTLTAAQIINIEKLAAIGDKAGAQAALMDALKIATMGLAESAMTPLGKATDRLSNSWDAMTSVMSKSDTLRAANNMLASMIDTVADLGNKLSKLKPPEWLVKQMKGGLNGLLYDAVTGGNWQGSAGTLNSGGSTGSFAPTSSEIDKQVKSALDAGKSYESQASAMNKLKDTSKQLKDALAALAAENKSGSVEAAMLRDRLAGLNERINKPKDGGAAKKIQVGAFDTSVISEYSKSMAALAALQIKAGASAENLSKTQTELRSIQSSPQWAAFNRRMQEELIMAASLSQAKEDEAEKAKALARAQEDLAKARTSAILSHVKELDAINDKAQKLEDELAMYGMSKEAIEALTTARMLDQIEVLKGFAGSDEEIARINETIKARQRLAVAQTGIDSKKETEKSAKDASDEWKKTGDTIRNSLTDSFVKAAEKGGNIFKNLFAGFRDLAKNTILQFVFKGVSGGITGALGFGGQASAATDALGGGGGGGLSSLSNLASIGSNMSSAFTVGSQVIAGSMSLANGAATIAANAMGTGISGLMTATGAFGTAAGAVTAASTASAAITANLALAAGTAPALAAGTLATAAGGTAVASGGIMAGASSVLAAIPVWGWAALGAAAVLSFASKKKDPQQVSTASTARAYGADGTVLSQTNQFAEPGAGITKVDALYASFAAMRDTLGAKGGAGFGYGSNVLDNGTKPMFRLGSGAFDSGEIAMTDESVKLAASRAIFTALKESELPRALSGLFDGLDAAALSQDQIDKVYSLGQALKAFDTQLQTMPFENLKNLSFKAAAGLYAASGGLEKFQSNLGTYFQNFYTQEEQRAQTIKDINAATAGSGLDAATATRESFKALVEKTRDMNTEMAQVEVARLLAVSGALSSILPPLDSVAKKISDVMQGLLNERGGLQANLLDAQGDTAGATALRRNLRFEGDQDNPADNYTAAEIAAYDYNQSIIAQTKTLQDASAALATAQADAKAAADQLAGTNAGLQDRLDVLLGKQTQRSLELRAATDDSTRSLINQINAQEDLKTALEATNAASKAAMQAFNQNVAGTIAKFNTPEQNTAAQYGRIAEGFRATGLAAADYSALQGDLQSASKDQIKAVAQKLFDSLGDGAYEAKESLRGLVDLLGDLKTAEIADVSAAIKAAQSNALAMLEKSVDRERRAAQINADLAAKNSSSIRSIFDLLKSNVNDLYGTVDSTRGMLASDGNAFIDNALANAKATGYLPDQTALADAIAASRKGIEGTVFASQVAQDIATLELAGKLSQLKDISGDQLTEAERMAKLANDQLTYLDSVLANAKVQTDLLGGINTSVLSVAAALAAFNSVTGASGAASTAGASNTASATAARVSDDTINAKIYGVRGKKSADGGAREFYDWAYGLRDQGMTLNRVDSIAGFPAGTAEQWAIANGLPLFANGGNHTGGWAMVGERGPELAYMPPARIYNNSDTNRMMSSGGNSDAAIERLTAKVEELTKELEKVTTNTARTAEATNGRPDRPMLVEVA